MPADDFLQHGFLHVPSFFSESEIGALLHSCKGGGTRNDYTRDDPDGGVIEVATLDPNVPQNCEIQPLWQKLNALAANLLGDAVSHYHTKYVAKPPLTGGAWQWHQDYWNWYHTGFLTPDMINICVALDTMNPESGGLDLVRGSHRLGRLDHVLLDRDGQRRSAKLSEESDEPIRIGVDPDRLVAVLKRFEAEPALLEPGDVLAFHGNCIHRSRPNRSSRPRRALICCFHSQSNERVSTG